ncbi:response regulator [Ferruginibacter sp. SUN002]|uniref:response regulator n=1 Tax=Ferruginibacter sp. SUN002 TaxID=2937789 RepID=UPI003D360D2D
MNRAEILVIDDEAAIQKLLEITLESNGFMVKLAKTAKEGFVVAANHPPDLIILDLGLPDESGHAVLVKLREWFTNPVIILSALANEENIVKALDNGANDYLVKPFRTGELLARIRSALRGSINAGNTPVIHCGNIQIDLLLRVVKKDDVVVKLTVTEYSLLSLFAKNEGKVLTHQYLLKEVWGPGYINQSQYLRVFIAQLRKKIEADANRPEIIVTESGIGYRFVVKE